MNIDIKNTKESISMKKSESKESYLFENRSDIIYSSSSDDVGQYTVNNWLPQHEKILKSWKAKCFVNMWLQNKSRYYYSFIQNLLTYPIIIITSCSGAVLFSYQYITINYVVSILSLISGILMAVMRQMKPEELEHEFSLTTRKYQTLIRKIDTILDVSPEMRKITPETCIERVTYEMDLIINSQLYPPAKIVKDFEKTFGNIHEILYGQDIIELLKRDLQNRKLVRKQLGSNDNIHNPFIKVTRDK